MFQAGTRFPDQGILSSCSVSDFLIFNLFLCPSTRVPGNLLTRGLTVCVTRWWAGVDNAGEQEKLEARKMLENAAESHTSGARFVSPPEFIALLMILAAPELPVDPS